MPAILIEEGPYTGWRSWARRPEGTSFGTALGPIYWRADETGQVRVRIETGPQHVNGQGALHGGFLMSFADMALYALAFRSLREVTAVTLTCNAEFLDAGWPGEPLEITGEILKETGRLIFLRGVIRQADRALLSFSGTLRKVPPRQPSEAGAQQD